MQTETWVIKEMASVTDKFGKLTLVRTGSVYGQLFLNVPLEDLALCQIGSTFEVSISPTIQPIAAAL